MADLLPAVAEQMPQLLFLVALVIAAAVVLREFRSIRRELGDEVNLRVKAEVGALLADIRTQSDEARAQLRSQLAEASKIQLELQKERANVEAQMTNARNETSEIVAEMRTERERLKDLIPQREEMEWISPRDLVAHANAAASWQDAFTSLALIDEDNATSKDLEYAGDVCRKHRFFAKAISFYRRATDKDPENSIARVELLALTAEIRPDERETALSELELLVKKNNKNTRVFSRYFNVLIELGRYESMAKFCLEQLRDTNPNRSVRVRLHRNLAVAYNNLDRPSEALQEFQEALALAPQDEDTLKSYAFVLRELKRLNEAAECYTRLLVIDPLDPHYFTGLADVKEEQGDFGGAEDLLSKAKVIASGAEAIMIETRLRKLRARKALEADEGFTDEPPVAEPKQLQVVSKEEVQHMELEQQISEKLPPTTD